MRYMVIALFLLFSYSTHAQTVTYQKWKKGESFSEYLERHNIGMGALEAISKDDIKYLSEVRSRYRYYEVVDDEGRLDEALIPLSEEMQVFLFQEKSGKYFFDIIPIVYEEGNYTANIEIKSNFYNDALEQIGNPKVIWSVNKAMKGIISEKKFRKGDHVAFIYKQKSRLGRLWGMPQLKVVKVTMRGKETYIYVDDEGYGYTSANGSVSYTVNQKKEVSYMRRVAVKGSSRRFIMPLRHARITSSFSYRRWHPILHRYRPHHGTDFGARKGTPLLAVQSGRVIFAGWMGGYGKVVKIRHAGGYTSLYAHQSRLRVKRGQRVKRGDIIGYVGNTGRSTGPHLHFGLMKRGRWIDPMRVLKKRLPTKHQLKRVTEYKNVKVVKYKKIHIEDAPKYQALLEKALKEGTASKVWQSIDENSCFDTACEGFEEDE